MKLSNLRVLFLAGPMISLMGPCYGGEKNYAEKHELTKFYSISRQLAENREDIAESLGEAVEEFLQILTLTKEQKLILHNIASNLQALSQFDWEKIAPILQNIKNLQQFMQLDIAEKTRSESLALRNAKQFHMILATLQDQITNLLDSFGITGTDDFIEKAFISYPKLWRGITATIAKKISQAKPLEKLKESTEEIDDDDSDDDDEEDEDD